MSDEKKISFMEFVAQQARNAAMRDMKKALPFMLNFVIGEFFVEERRIDAFSLMAIQAAQEEIDFADLSQEAQMGARIMFIQVYLLQLVRLALISMFADTIVVAHEMQDQASEVLFEEAFTESAVKMNKVVASFDQSWRLIAEALNITVPVEMIVKDHEERAKAEEGKNE